MGHTGTAEGVGACCAHGGAEEEVADLWGLLKRLVVGKGRSGHTGQRSSSEMVSLVSGGGGIASVMVTLGIERSE